MCYSSLSLNLFIIKEHAVIQVVNRAFGILEHLAANGPTTVKELAETTRLKKSTLCNILKTLTELRYVRKTQRGLYQVGDRLAEVAYPQLQHEALVRLGRETVVALADATAETVQLAVLRKGERYIIVEARCKQGLTVNTAVLGSSVFTSATGRVLLAHLAESKLKELVRKRKPPGPEWKGIRRTKSALARIRTEGLFIYKSGDGQVAGLGVPVFAAAGKVQAALGVYLPAVRFRGAHRKEVVGFLRKAGIALSLRLSAELGETPLEGDA